MPPALLLCYVYNFTGGKKDMTIVIFNQSDWNGSIGLGSSVHPRSLSLHIDADKQ